MIKIMIGIFIGWMLVEFNAIDHAKSFFVESGGRDIVIEKLKEVESE